MPPKNEAMHRNHRLLHRSASTLITYLVSVAVLLLASGCAEYPRDPEHTTEQVDAGVLRVGVIHDPPFVRLRGPGEPQGAEAELARALARAMDARVVWSSGGQDELLVDLEEFRIDLVLGGLSAETPWKDRIALTRPFKARDAHGRLVSRVAAVPPGENRWQLQVERFTRGEVARTILEGATDPASTATATTGDASQ